MIGHDNLDIYLFRTWIKKWIVSLLIQDAEELHNDLKKDIFRTLYLPRSRRTERKIK